MKNAESRSEISPTMRPVKHSPEAKVSIARQVIEEHANQAELSRQTKISRTNIHKWVRMARQGELPGYTPPAFDEKTGDLTAENRRLQRELTRVTQERDFLKRAAAFFAKETR